MEKIDLAIIGNGPAGVSAAITAKVRNVNFKLFGNLEYSKKLQLTQKIENYPGEYNISGQQLIDKYKKQLELMNIEVCTERVINIFDMSSYFMIVSDSQQYYCDSVIIASGIPLASGIRGEREFLGKGVSYCATCDGNFFKNKTIAVYCDNPALENEVSYLLDIVDQIYYYPTFKSQLVSDKLEIVNSKFSEVVGENVVEAVLLADGSVIEIDGLFVFRNEVDAKSFMSNLKMQNGFIVVDGNMETNVKGLFAAGDITGRPFQIAKALGQGNVAALSAVEFLESRKKDNL